MLKHGSNLPRRLPPTFLGFGDDVSGHPGHSFGRGEGRAETQFPASVSGFSTEHNHLLSAKLGTGPLSLVRPRLREFTPGPRPPLRRPFPPRTLGTELWHGGARCSGFHLGNTDLQPRPEPPGAARSSGKRAPQLKASLSALLGALYLPSGVGTGLDEPLGPT